MCRSQREPTRERYPGSWLDRHQPSPGLACNRSIDLDPSQGQASRAFFARLARRWLEGGQSESRQVGRQVGRQAGRQDDLRWRQEANRRSLEEERNGAEHGGEEVRGEGSEAVRIDDAWYQRLGRATPLQTSSSQLLQPPPPPFSSSSAAESLYSGADPLWPANSATGSNKDFNCALSVSTVFFLV